MRSHTMNDRSSYIRCSDINKQHQSSRIRLRQNTHCTPSRKHRTTMATANLNFNTFGRLLRGRRQEFSMHQKRNWSKHALQLVFVRLFLAYFSPAFIYFLLQMPSRMPVIREACPQRTKFTFVFSNEMDANVLPP